MTVSPPDGAGQSAGLSEGWPGPTICRVRQVAVIGAGVAGLGAAYALRAQARVAVFEAGSRLGGRARTCRHGPVRFDMGAQFFRTESSLSERLVLHELPGDSPVNIVAPVHTFDGDGVVRPGDPEQNARPKWTYPDGIAGLAARLLRAAGTNVWFGATVIALHRDVAGWTLQTARGPAGPFVAVVCAVPPASALPVLRASRLPAGVAAGLLGALEGAAYRPIISVAFGVRLAPFPLDAYALVDTTREHAISWVASERHKPGYLPPGHDVVVAQMAAAWSAPRLDGPGRDIVREAWLETAALLGRRDWPAWAEVVRWPHALPDRLVDSPSLTAGEDGGLFFATDGTVGGRISLALAEGLSSGQRLVHWLTRS